MAGYIEDRWLTKRPDPATGEKRKTARWGVGKRYRVAGIAGVKDRSFKALTGPAGANAWKAKAEHESAKGEFIDPRAGNMLLDTYVHDHWWPSKTGDIMTLHKAMQWEDYQAAQVAKPAEMAAAQAKAKEKAAKAPPVQKPGPPHTNEKSDRAKEKFQTFQKSGHTDDLAKFLVESGLA